MSFKYNSGRNQIRTPAVCYSKRISQIPTTPPPPIPEIPKTLFASIDFRNEATGIEKDYDSNYERVNDSATPNLWFVEYIKTPEAKSTLSVIWTPATKIVDWEVSTIPDWKFPINWMNFTFSIWVVQDGLRIVSTAVRVL